MSELQFTVSEAAFLADVKVTTLKVWRQRKVVTLEQDEGRGRWGRFTFGDVLKAATVQSLTTKSISASDASTIAAAGARCFPETFKDFRKPGANPAYLLHVWKTPLAETDSNLLVEFADSLAQLLDLIAKHSESPVLEHFSVTDFNAISANVSLRYLKMQKGERPA